ncbi:reverse transcriptase domain-containing protein [Tanacetum coccineum]|uniref:Reverse transcriptase domain-containing protein n=1 Tax=Tanacetum coccineum TaxID=301880 RepID=A0ABQ5BYY9_9ASTR
MDFMVVRSMSPFNGIIGRSGLRKMKAVPSTTHGMIKFPVMGGTLMLRSSKIIPIECAMISGPEDQPPPANKVKEERIKVAINSEHPEQTVMIGFDLTEKTRCKLCNLLQRSLDIFAWTPTDMTGVPRQIAEHKLNVRKGCQPVRQKKRGQAAERNVAINDEVSKLVTAGIMREVHYHDWLSNPVMVKKSDNIWRMCVDFKDLNKACPKDGYPLPEIDWKVESLCGFPFKYFLDAYKGYHQIQMAEEDEEKTAFITNQGIFCYTKMPFGLRNAGATNLSPNPTDSVDKTFHGQIAPTRAAQRTRGTHCPKLAVSKGSGERRTHNGKGGQADANLLCKRALRGPKLTTTAMEKLPRVSVKGRVLANFIMERLEEKGKNDSAREEEPLPAWWTLFTDGSSCVDGCGAGVILTDPEGVEFTYALRFQFETTNNEAEYEAFIAGLRIAEKIGTRSVVAKALRTGYYWLTMHKDARALIKACQECQGIDIAGPFPEGTSKVKSLIVAMDYFTKWIDVKPVATITGSQVKKFVWENIVCRFGLPGEIISDNGKQFRDNPFKDWCEKLCIQQHFASVKHPQTNGLVERANRILGEGIKARLGKENKN